MILVAGLFCLGNGVLFAQDLDPSDFANPTLNLQEWTKNNKGNVYLTQVGDGNVSDVAQSGAISKSAPNIVRSLQIGELNSIQAIQEGSLLRTDVYQYGSNNTVYSSVQGSSIESTLIQNGDFNLVSQKITNSSLITTEFQQNGNNNKIEQTVDGKSNLPFRLIQNGSNLTVIINQSGSN